MKKRIKGIAILTLSAFLSLHVTDFIRYVRNEQDNFEIQYLILIPALFASIIGYAFINAKDERGKPREWDREDWVDPLADDDEDKK